MQWMNIGLSLGISPSDLDAIKTEAGPSADACLRAVIEFWLTHKKLSPTWAALAAALRSPIVGYMSLAHKIQAL